MIKAVIFDWGGVLIDNPAPGLVSYCAGQLGVEENVYVEVYDKFDSVFQNGMISEDMLWERICAALGVVEPNVRSLYGDAFQSVYVEKARMFSLASFLKSKGYKIGLLSNTELPAVKYFYERGYKVFDATIFSCLEGTRKPEEAIYRIAAERLFLQVKDIVFIDDREDYGAGARKAGMNFIAFKNEEQVLEELQGLLGHSLQ